MNTQNLIESLENGFANMNSIKGQLVERELIQLTSNVEGYSLPDSYGVYKQGGGMCLGTVGTSYEPINLNRFYDIIERSILECGNGLELSKLTYKEYFGGKKVAFEIPLPTKLVNSGIAKDAIDFKLHFFTGFDGLTKTSLNFYTYRQICANGMKGWIKDLALSFKNTKGNSGKELLLCNDIFKAIDGTKSYIQVLNQLATKKVDKKQVREFVAKLTGYDLEKPSSSRQANILEDIMYSIDKEMEATGQTAFSLLQGITRHTTHYKAKGEESAILFETAGKMNAYAYALVSVI